MTANLITPGMSFSETEHRYALNGVTVPGVTEIINAAGLSNHRAEQYYLDRGSAIHAACHFLEEGDLDRNSLDPAIVPYVAAYELFMRECVRASFCSEVALVHKSMRFGGTIDRMLWLNSCPALAVPDWKSGGSSPAYEVQLAGYDLLIADNADEMGIRPWEIPKDRFIVRLLPTGKYSIQSLKMTHLRARNIFVAALTIWNFRRENNLLPKEN